MPTAELSRTADARPAAGAPNSKTESAPPSIPVAIVAGPAFKARAFLLGERLDLRAQPPGDVIALSPVTLAVAGGGVAVLFRYGAAVLFGVPDAAQSRFIDMLRPLIGAPYEKPETEEAQIRIDPSSHDDILGGTLHLETLTAGRLQVIADVLSKSVVLALYESGVGQSFDRIEPLATDLRRTGRLPGKSSQLLRQIGAMLLSEQTMMGRVEITEKPEMLWEHPELEGLFLRTEDEFEIRERYIALGRKLDFISQTVRTLLDLLNSRHTLRVEWYIVILIVVEIVLTLYTMATGTH